MSLSLLFWSTCAVALVSFWWQSDKVKGLAMTLVLQHCREQNLQLLDQTMVLRGVWPVRGRDDGLHLRRRYSFEFTSTGEERYNGLVEMVGRRLHRLELAPHIIPDSTRHLH